MLPRAGRPTLSAAPHTDMIPKCETILGSPPLFLDEGCPLEWTFKFSEYPLQLFPYWPFGFGEMRKRSYAKPSLVQ